MAIEVRAFQVLIPKGTLKASPQSTALTFPPRRVEAVVIRVPPGPRGEVGFQLGVSGTQLVPTESGTFIVADNEVIAWVLENLPDSGAFTLIAYNTGSFDHTLYVRFLVGLPLVAAQAAGFVPLSASAISFIPGAVPGLGPSAAPFTGQGIQLAGIPSAPGLAAVGVPIPGIQPGIPEVAIPGGPGGQGAPQPSPAVSPPPPGPR